MLPQPLWLGASLGASSRDQEQMAHRHISKDFLGHLVDFGECWVIIGGIMMDFGRVLAPFGEPKGSKIAKNSLKWEHQIGSVRRT